jgi:hypothetical protein
MMMSSQADQRATLSSIRRKPSDVFRSASMAPDLSLFVDSAYRRTAQALGKAGPGRQARAR